MNNFDEGVKIYSIDENQQELVVHIGKLREFYNEYKQLKDNWNKLKEWLEEEIKYDENWYKPECKEYIGQKRYPDDTIDGFNYVLDKMQEIEGGMNE
jgi:hypothetical protein